MNTAPPFDPYHKWLGIAPKDQPPNYYRLLGIDDFESDPDVISNAAEQRMAHVRSYQLGKHIDLSQKILNEIAAARVCLLDPAKKFAYDVGLKEQLCPVVAPVVTPATVRPATKRTTQAMLLVVGAVAVCVLVALLLLSQSKPVATAEARRPLQVHKASSIKPAPEPKVEPESNPNVHPDPKPEPESNVQAEPKSAPDPVIGPAPVLSPDPETQAEATMATQPTTDAPAEVAETERSNVADPAPADKPKEGETASLLAQAELTAEKGKPQRGLNDLLNAPGEKAPDKDVKITPALIRRKFRARVTFDAKGNELTLVYDFRKNVQLQDFDLNGSEPLLANGVLGLGPAQSVRHIVKFKTVTITGVLANKGKGDYITSTGGLRASREGNWIGIGNGVDYTRFHGAGEKEVNQFAIEFTEKAMRFRLGKGVVGKETQIPPVGQIQLSGGESGAGFSLLTLKGEIDPEWAEEFFKQ